MIDAGAQDEAEMDLDAPVDVRPQFRADLVTSGYAILRSVVPMADVERIRSAIRVALQDQARELTAVGKVPAHESALASDLDRGLLYLLEHGIGVSKPVTGGQPRPPIGERLEELRRHPALVVVAKSLLGERIVATPQYALRAHCPGRMDVRFPWHQDVYFLSLDDKEAARIINFWIPLVPIDADAGGIDIIAGSHQFGVLDHARESVVGAPAFTTVVPSLLPDGERVIPTLELGDAVMMTEKTVHRTRINASNRIRWSIDLRYAEAGRPVGREGNVLTIS